jgi:drug/metabolite transporter (DMT)-like permease
MVIAAHLFLPDEKMTTNKVFGVVLALMGSLFLVVRGESGLVGVGRASSLGFLLVMMALCSETINTILVRRRMIGMDPMTVTGIRLGAGALAVSVVTLFWGNYSLAAVTPMGYFALGCAAIIGALGGQFLAFYITRQFSATAFSLTSYVTPIVATILGVLILDEIVTWAMLVGMVLVGGGIYLINRTGYATKPALSAPVGPDRAS